MQITELHLKGSLRLLNKGTTEIHWTPTSPHQLIMGGNGYGKSTLMSEFSLLPAETNRYAKNGYKKVVATHNNREYVAISDFSSKHVHSFHIDNGPNLNDGGTITVQKLLIKEHLGYTSELHELAQGKIKFTELSANKRKEWFARISEVNVDYGLKVFSKLKTEARNILGAQKNAELQLLNEQSKVLSEADKLALKSDIDNITVRIGEINKSRDNYIPSAETSDLDKSIRKIEQYTADINGLGDLPNRLSDSPETFKDECITAAEEVRALEAKITALHREQELVNNVLDLLQDEDKHPLSEVIAQRDLAQSKCDQIDIKFNMSMDTISYPESAVTALSSLIDDLDDIYLNLRENRPEDLYDGARLTKVQTHWKELTEEVARLDNQIDSKANRLNALKSHDPVDCPKCTHRWVPGVSDTEVKTLEVDLEAIIVQRDIVQRKFEDVNLELEDINAYVFLRRRLATLGSQYPVLKHYWSLIHDSSELNTAPTSLPKLTRRYLNSLSAFVDKVELIKTINELNDVIEQREHNLRRAEDLKVNTKTTRLEELIWTTQEALKVANVHKKELQDTYGKVNRALTLNNLLEKELANYFNIYTNLWDHSRENILKDTITQLGAEHYNKLAKLNELEAVNKVVEHIRTNLDTLNSQAQTYEDLIAALSPTSGIIANTLVGFMNEFIDQMNNIISRIWTTRLQILPCSIRKDEFTYQFPVKAEAETHQMTDIGDGSTAELDIINFVFRLIAMQYLKLDNYPLTIDELGSSFTATHKRKLYDYLKLLVDSGNTSQLVVISHFTDAVDELNRADVNVIDSTGLLVPPGANKYFKVHA